MTERRRSSKKNIGTRDIGTRMAIRKFIPGSIVRIKLQDGSYSFGRLLKVPFAAFHNYRTNDANPELQEIVSKPVLFILAVHKSALNKGQWEILGHLPLAPRFLRGVEQFIQDPTRPERCRIIDYDGNIRDASVEECVGLEAAAVWEPEHVQDRLMDYYLERRNQWVESLSLKLPVTGS